MKKTIYLLFLLLMSAGAIAQNKPVNTTDAYTVVEQMPQFPGGEKALFTYLSQNLKYPAIAVENGIQGTVIVRFVVQKDGSIGTVEIRRSLDMACDKEVIRLVSSMPQWSPGKQNGAPVSVWYTMPVSFRLDGDTDLNKSKSAPAQTTVREKQLQSSAPNNGPSLDETIAYIKMKTLRLRVISWNPVNQYDIYCKDFKPYDNLRPEQVNDFELGIHSIRKRHVRNQLTEGTDKFICMVTLSSIEDIYVDNYELVIVKGLSTAWINANLDTPDKFELSDLRIPYGYEEAPRMERAWKHLLKLLNIKFAEKPKELF